MLALIKISYYSTVQFIIDQFINLFQTFHSEKNNLPLISISGLSESRQHNCHIVGSGLSALSTLEHCNPTEVFITSNLSVALRKSWDVAFVESDGNKNFCEKQVSALQGKLISKLVFKNNYPHRHIKNFSRLNFDNKMPSFILSESPFFGRRIHYASEVCWHDLGFEGMFHQYASSLFTMIRVAMYFRPKTITLHGIDFGGQCFYHHEDWKHLDPGESTHISTRGRIESGNVKAVLLEISGVLLKQHKIEILHAH